MIKDQAFSKLEIKTLWGAFGILVFALFYHLGIYPLFLEEPRRALIALEMLISDNIWVPTQTGDLYFRKPPVYNWLLILSYKIFGEYSEFASRFFSVLSHLVLGGTIFFFTRKYLNLRVAVYSALGYLVSADILMSYSMLGEIDLFYALSTALSIFLIYHLGEKQRLVLLFVSVYALTAIGFLTKGLTSLPFTAISLLVYFIITKRFKQLLSWQHAFGIVVFGALSAAYFYKYALYEDPKGWLDTLFSESADKAQGGGFLAILKHMVSFPLDTVKILLPVSLFLPLLFIKGSIKRLKSNTFLWFCLLVFIFNYPIYLISAEAKSRYIYPILPFLTITLVYLANSVSLNWHEKTLKVIAAVIASIMAAASCALPFIKSLDFVSHKWALSVAILVLSISLLVLIFRANFKTLTYFILIMVVARLAMSGVVPDSRAKTTGAAEDRTLAIEMAELTKGASLYRYKDLRMSLSIVFYLERDRWDIIESTDTILSGYYIAYEEDLSDFNDYELLRSFKYNNRIPMHLIKVKE